MAIRAAVQGTTSDVLEVAEDKLGVFADKAYEAGKAHAENAVKEQRNAFKRFALTIVRALRSGSDELRSEGYATVAGVVEDVAAKAEEMTDEIDDLDLRSTTDRIESFVRDRPVIAYGAIALAGFLVANTLQAASSARAVPVRAVAPPRRKPAVRRTSTAPRRKKTA